MRKIEGQKNVSLRLDDEMAQWIDRRRARTMARFIRRAIAYYFKILNRREKLSNGRSGREEFFDKIDDWWERRRRIIKARSVRPLTGKTSRVRRA